MYLTTQSGISVKFVHLWSDRVSTMTSYLKTAKIMLTKGRNLPIFSKNYIHIVMNETNRAQNAPQRINFIPGACPHNPADHTAPPPPLHFHNYTLSPLWKCLDETLPVLGKPGPGGTSAQISWFYGVKVDLACGANVDVMVCESRGRVSSLHVHTIMTSMDHHTFGWRV